MNRVKFLEIRDKATFIPVVAVDCSNPDDHYLLGRAGYGKDRCVLLTNLNGGKKAYYDHYDWGDRTYQVAHGYIINYWDQIVDGEVIDVEFILKRNVYQENF